MNGRGRWAWFGLIPFVVVVVVFGLVPAVAVVWNSLFDTTGRFGFKAFGDALAGDNRHALLFSGQVAALSASVGLVIGGLLAFAVTRARRHVRFAATTREFWPDAGGLPFVFSFVALLGPQGLVTRILSGLGAAPYSGDRAIGSLWTFITAYAFFQIPLMMLVTLPVMGTLTASARDAARNLGASRFNYWRRIAFAVLMPSFVGAFALMFATAFGGFAVARLMTTSSPLATLRVGDYLTNNVHGVVDPTGYALATLISGVVCVCVGVYLTSRKRSRRWQGGNPANTAQLSDLNRAARWRRTPVFVVVMCVILLALALLAMARFALQSVPGSELGWSNMFEQWSWGEISNAVHAPGFSHALILSLKLMVAAVALTLGLVVPTTLWVHLRMPKARPYIDILAVTPFVITPIALAAGIRLMQPQAPAFFDSELSLVPFYVVLALPFAYRTLDAGIRAIDVVTLADASRSLGAGWGATLRRVLIANLRGAIVSASFLTAAVVLGEFTIARVLLKPTLPQFIGGLQARQPRGAVGLVLIALAAMTAVFAALAPLKRGGRSGRTTQQSILENART